MKYNYDFKEGPNKVDFRLNHSDVPRIVVKGYANGTVRLKIYHEGRVLIQAVMCNQAAIDLGTQIMVIGRDNE